VYTEGILTWKALEFVKGKPKGTNSAITGDPINTYAVNVNNKQSIGILITKETNSKLSEPRTIQ